MKHNTHRTPVEIKDALKEIRKTYGIFATTVHTAEKVSDVIPAHDTYVVVFYSKSSKTAYIHYPQTQEWGEAVFDIFKKHCTYQIVAWAGRSIYNTIQIKF
jgi:hypothetical protein